VQLFPLIKWVIVPEKVGQGDQRDKDVLSLQSRAVPPLWADLKPLKVHADSQAVTC
jgi:hypothetical protein